MDSIVLVGGKGSRLKSVLPDLPKPMASVAGRPFLEWLLFYLRSQGIKRVVLATGYKHEMIETHFTIGSHLGLDIVYSQESIPLDTGGAVRLALEKTRGERVLVVNGDSFCPFDLEHMSRVGSNKNADGLMWLIPIEDCSRYGAVEMDNNDEITAFVEKRAQPHAGLINAGVYMFSQEILREQPLHQSLSLERQIIPKLVGKGLFGIRGIEPFIDIGTPESLASAESFIHQIFLEGELLLDGT